ncbi:hypothetical protein K8R47_01810 [archaeon]|nr:hypothetical protein [archaeon]
MTQTKTKEKREGNGLFEKLKESGEDYNYLFFNPHCSNGQLKEKFSICGNDNEKDSADEDIESLRLIHQIIESSTYPQIKGENQQYAINAFGNNLCYHSGGERILFHFMKYPLRSSQIIRYVQEGVKELVEVKDIKKRVDKNFQELNGVGWINRGRGGSGSNIRYLVKSQTSLEDLVKALESTDSQILRDIRTCFQTNLKNKNLIKGFEISNKEKHILTFDLNKGEIFYSEESFSNRFCTEREVNPTDFIWSYINNEVGEEGNIALEEMSLNGNMLGFINGLASLAQHYEKAGIPYCFPSIHDKGITEIYFKGAVHPLLIGEKDLTLNDIKLNENKNSALIAGAVNGGKTTYAKMTALLTLLGQIGAPVPARESRISPIDKIYTHFARNQSVLSGEGKFVDELNRLRYVLENVTERDLVICDEPCSSAANEDSTKVSLDLLKGLHAIGCPTIYTTHNHSLQNEIAQNSIDYGCTNLYVETKGTKEDPEFTHKIRQGIAGRSYGTKYAEKFLPVFQILDKRGIKIHA